MFKILEKQKTNKKKINSALVSLRNAFHLQGSHWGHAGWETGGSIPSRPGRCRCLFWSDCGLADWCRRSSPSGAVSRSFPQILYPDKCSKDSPSSGRTHWCVGRSTEPQCIRHRPSAERQRHTCKQSQQVEHYKSFLIWGTDTSGWFSTCNPMAYVSRWSLLRCRVTEA